MEKLYFFSVPILCYGINSMKIILVLSLVIGLAACDFMTGKSPAFGTCAQIAKSRLKHPASYEVISVVETKPREDQILVSINFSAWNDFKVPIPHNISCVFQVSETEDTTDLIAIKWNGRPVRSHELDDIRQSLSK